MNNFGQIMKAVQMMQTIQNSMGVSFQVAKIFEQQTKITKQFSSTFAIAEITKSVYKNPAISAMNAFARSQNSIATLPNETIRRLNSINRHYELLFGNIRTISEVFKKQETVLSKISNWQFAISGIAEKLAQNAAMHQNWGIIDDFEYITTEAIAINEKIYRNETVSKSNIEDYLNRIETKVQKIDKDNSALLWKVIIILSFLFEFIGSPKDWVSHSNYATKQEVETIIKKQFNQLTKTLKRSNQTFKTKEKTEVKLEPNAKSVSIEILPKDFEFVVIQNNENWIFITYKRQKDSLPESGWIMKKSLDIEN